MLLLVFFCAVADVAAILNAVRIMVRPMNQAAQVVPFVHAANMHTVAHDTRCTSVSDDVVDVVEVLLHRSARISR